MRALTESTGPEEYGIKMEFYGTFEDKGVTAGPLI
jgi:hypothetical protein